MQETDKNLIESAFHILLDEIHGNAVDHGFWETAPDGRVLVDLRNKAEQMLLEVSEIIERFEATRSLEMPKDEHCPEFTSEEIEAADVLIRVFDYAKAYKLRLAEAVFAKHQYNIGRPYKHGKRF